MSEHPIGTRRRLIVAIARDLHGELATLPLAPDEQRDWDSLKGAAEDTLAGLERDAAVAAVARTLRVLEQGFPAGTERHAQVDFALALVRRQLADEATR